MKFLTTIMAAIMVLASPAHAQTDVGSTIPHSFDLIDQQNQKQSFDTLKGEKGLVVFFVRSAEWCPYCQKQIVEINESAEEISALGYNIASVSYDDTSTLSAFSKKHDIAYPMLSDSKSESIKAFGILNEKMEKGTKYYGVPNPAIYIIGADKKVQAILAEDGYKNRPPALKIIEGIKKTN